MTSGIVKWFNDTKGFGFITPEGGGKDVFVHYRDINPNGGGRRTLSEGQEVQFNIEDSPKGKRATNVQVAKQIRRG
jgi:Cold shock proteins